MEKTIERVKNSIQKNFGSDVCMIKKLPVKVINGKLYCEVDGKFTSVDEDNTQLIGYICRNYSIARPSKFNKKVYHMSGNEDRPMLIKDMLVARSVVMQAHPDAILAPRGSAHHLIINGKLARICVRTRHYNNTFAVGLHDLENLDILYFVDASHEDMTIYGVSADTIRQNAGSFKYRNKGGEYYVLTNSFIENNTVEKL